MSFNIINEPWFESPFFYQILKSKKNPFFKKYAIDMHEKGYCVLDLNLSDNFIDNLNRDIEKSLAKGKTMKLRETMRNMSKQPQKKLLKAAPFHRNSSIMRLRERELQRALEVYQF